MKMVRNNPFYVFFQRTIVGVLLLGMMGSCVGTPKRLAASERRLCIANGGYESRSGFGYPICQFKYADGGKSCLRKSDCQGRCLLAIGGPPEQRVPQPGETGHGLCEAEKSTFGCYAEIEDGKISSDGAWCDD